MSEGPCDITSRSKFYENGAIYRHLSKINSNTVCSLLLTVYTRVFHIIWKTEFKESFFNRFGETLTQCCMDNFCCVNLLCEFHRNIFHFDHLRNTELYIYIYIYIYISSRIFENIPQNAPEYSHRKLAIASFLVTAVRKNIGACCPAWSHCQVQSLN